MPLCKRSGATGLAHILCLEQWRNAQNVDHCDRCHHHFPTVAQATCVRHFFCVFDTFEQALKGRIMGEISVVTLAGLLITALCWYRNTPTTTTGQTPAELFLSGSPRTRLTMLHPDRERLMEERFSETLGPKPLLGAPVPFRFARLPGLLPHRRSNPETQLSRNNQMQLHIKALLRQRLLSEYLCLL
ncbi:hypothetical protein MRX96_017291 [Rhipicephalus microplus]